MTDKVTMTDVERIAAIRKRQAAAQSSTGTKALLIQTFTEDLPWLLEQVERLATAETAVDGLRKRNNGLTGENTNLQQRLERAEAERERLIQAANTTLSALGGIVKLIEHQMGRGGAEQWQRVDLNGTIAEIYGRLNVMGELAAALAPPADDSLIYYDPCPRCDSARCQGHVALTADDSAESV